MQKNQKICKVIEELSLFLLESNASNLDIHIEQRQDKSILVFSFEDCEAGVKEYLKKKIRGQRDIEIEEYGWELIGEGSSGDDLEIINALMDTIEFKEENDKFEIRMVRNEF